MLVNQYHGTGQVCGPYMWSYTLCQILGLDVIMLSHSVAWSWYMYCLFCMVLDKCHVITQFRYSMRHLHIIYNLISLNMSYVLTVHLVINIVFGQMSCVSSIGHSMWHVYCWMSSICHIGADHAPHHKLHVMWLWDYTVSCDMVMCYGSVCQCTCMLCCVMCTSVDILHMIIQLCLSFTDSLIRRFTGRCKW